MPRTIAGKAWRSSAQLGIRSRTLLLTSWRGCGRSRLAMISPSPNSPMAIGTKSSPSPSSGMPKVRREAPEETSMPTMPSRSPTTTMASALATEPCARITAAIRPSTSRLKYSTAVNCSARAASGRASSAITTVATVPAKKEEMAAMASASPALPWRAIWWPSRQVTTDDVSPGTLTRIAVVEPP